MKSVFYLIAMDMILVACTPAANPAPPPISGTPSVRIPNSIFPTPTEPAPAGTVTNTDAIGNKYAETDGAPTHWFNSETNKWERFQPIDFFDPNEWQYIDQGVVYTSGFYEKEINRAISHRRWQPKGKDIKYAKSGDFELSNYDIFGEKHLFIPEPRKIPLVKVKDIPQNVLEEWYNYSMQPTDFHTVFRDHGKDYYVFTQILYYQTTDGRKVQQPVSFKIPLEELNKHGAHIIFPSLTWRSGTRPHTATFYMDFDPERVDHQVIEDLRRKENENPSYPERLASYYLADQQDPSYQEKHDVLLRLYKGDETALQKIGKFLYIPIIWSASW